MKDPYVTLGVSKNATAEEIKKAYRKLARELHPDVNQNNPSAAERFKDVTAAYDILSDKTKRARYDNGEIDGEGNERPGFNFNQGGSGGGAYWRGSSKGGFDFSDIFGGASFGTEGGFSDFASFFRGGNSRERSFKQKGSDINYSMEVSFIDAALGAEKEVKLANGKRIKVKIPSGTDNETILRLKEQGNPGIGGGRPGDAMVRILVNKHPLFTREGLDIIAEIPISIKEAVKGGKITVPTLDGKVSVTVPEGSNHGSILRLRGKGISKGGKRGDLLLKLYIVISDTSDTELNDFLSRWHSSEADVRKKAGII